ncbi:MAG: Ig-like domain-containing protein [Sulfurovaceae bacterium]
MLAVKINNKVVKGTKIIVNNTEKIIITDATTGSSPKKIITKKIGKDLYIFEEGESEPSVVLEDYYGQEIPAQLYGVDTSGGYLQYTVVDSTSMELLGNSVETAGIGDSAGAGMAAIGILAAGGIGLALSSGSGNNGDSATVIPPVDTLAPTAVITMSDTALILGETSTVTITFSEAVTAFANEDLTIENGTLSAVVSIDGGITWSATFTPSADIEDTTNVISLANTYTDMAGNTGTVAASANYTVDTIAPIVSIVTPASSIVQLEAIGNTAGADLSPQITSVGSAGEYVVTWQGVDSAGDNSIFVQKFNANGTTTGNTPVQLEAIGKTNGADLSPQITSVGSTGEYVVTWYGTDNDIPGDNSIFVQKFNADGTTAGNTPVQLEAIGNTTNLDQAPQITSVGSTGEYVVTWYGVDSAGDNSIFVQKFNANGTTTGNTPVQLEAIGNTAGADLSSQITSVGSAGEYVVTWYGVDSTDNSIFVQKFNADGTTAGSTVQLEAIGKTNGADFFPQITSVGSAGEYVVTWYGADSAGDRSIFVQKFNADGTTAGSTVQLEAIGNTAGADERPQIISVGSTGEYVVTWYGTDNDIPGDNSIFVQKFNADGTTAGSTVQLEAIGRTYSSDAFPQITSVGSAGEYVVTWFGTDNDSPGDNSIFVQKFNADGTTAGSTVQLEAIGNTIASDAYPQITSVGSTGEYVVTWQGIDSAGDNSIFTQKFNADGTIATLPAIAISNDTGISGSDFITSAAAQTITATLTSALVIGEKLYGSTDGGTTWTDITVKVTDTAVNWDNATLMEGSNSIQLKVSDEAGNDGVITTQGYTLDMTAPTAVITMSDTALILGETSTVTITFSEAVTAFDNTDLLVENGTLSAVASLDGGITWSATFTPSADIEDTTNVISLANTYTDMAGNTGTVAASANYTVDTIAPTVSIVTSSLIVQLEAIGKTNGADFFPQITSVGSTGEYVVTWYGVDSAGDNSIFVQKFNANGTTTGNTPVQLEAIGNTIGADYGPQITSVGSAGEYVVTWYGAESTPGDYSIFVQKFNADGTTTGSTVQLEAIGNTTNFDQFPQITSVGLAGEYVVTWQGADSAGDYSIFVQKFNADGTTTGNTPVQLEAIGKTNGGDLAPQITSVGLAGEYVVTWYGVDNDISGDYSIFVQKFNADGTTTGNTPVQLEAIGYTAGTDQFPQITSVGSAGEYVVTWYGADSAGDNSIFVQKFNADGTTTGNTPVQLEAIGNTTGADQSPQITSVGSTGEYVVTWYGADGAGDTSIFVQKFNADGTTAGSTVQLEAIGNTAGLDGYPQITSVGSAGEYVVTWYGADSAGDNSIFVQKFNADGTTTGNVPVQLEAIGRTYSSDELPQITSVGSAGEYVVTWYGVDSAGDNSIFVQKFNADGTIATLPAIAISNDTGISGSDFITSVAAQTITATLTSALVIGEKLYGSTDGGTTWTDITIKVTDTAVNWDNATLIEGSNSIQLKVSDEAGNDGVITTQDYTLDMTAPTLSSSTPADNATSIAGSDNIVLTFNENIMAGLGDIILSDGTTTHTIAITDGQIFISGATVIINPTVDLSTGGWNVQIASGVIQDVAGNAYGGILDSTTLNFTVI